jgi:tetratricopeptide (TPR) repeat protein
MFGVGQELAGRFRLTRRLGGSDAAPVWLASDRERPEPVVLKLRSVNEDKAGDDRAAAHDIDHPGIARRVAQLRDADRHVQVFEFSALGDLGARRGRACTSWLPQVREVAVALSYLHARGLVHGDVKAANVLIDGGGHALLADLETLKPIGAPRPVSEPGSRYTSSPQQRSGAEVQVADDIYSFGALLYELLCAEPPGYERHGGSAAPAPDAVPAITPVQPAPPELLALAQRCLAAEAEQRPATMQEIADALAEIESVATSERSRAPILTPPNSAADVIRPSWKRTESPVTRDAQQLRSQGFRQGVLVAAAVALAVLAVLLFVWPTHRAASTVAQQPTAAIKTDVAAPAADLQALATAKTDAETRLDGISARVKSLEQSGAMTWNATAMTTATVALAEVDALMKQREYTSATQRMTALASVVKQLESGRAPALAAALQRGQSALQQTDSQSAAVAFALALTIDPDNHEAQRGARRAASLDALVAELAKATSLEQSGRLADAASAYRHALSLDGASTAAQSGVSRLQAQLATNQFGQTLARAYAELAAGRSAAARESLNAAARLRPSDPEVLRAQAQLAAAEVGTQLGTALANARDAERNEQWIVAGKLYQQAVALDGTLVTARGGLTNALARAQLDRELQSLVSHPERAYSSAVHDAAAGSLRRAQAIAHPGPILAGQISAVTTILHAADTPLDVALRSDGLTSVTVYKVGELGSFTERTLQLRPGRYIVVGARGGYRDVRRELNVLPGSELTPLTVQCSEPL